MKPTNSAKNPDRNPYEQNRADAAKCPTNEPDADENQLWPNDFYRGIFQEARLKESTKIDGAVTKIPAEHSHSDGLRMWSIGEPPTLENA